jgi:rod shape-determining protein MreD
LSVAESSLVAVIVFVAALLQVTLVASLDLGAGSADVLLLTVIALSLLRGAIVGSICGFFGGLLLDVVTLDTLGVSALLYALVGYWVGRYGETTGRGRAHAVVVSALVATIAIAYAGYGLHFVLGEEVSGRRVLLDALLPAILLNVLLAKPVYALWSAALDRISPPERVTEVRLLG